MSGRYIGAAPLVLRTHLADRPNTHGLVSGEITSPLLTLDICGPASVSKGFKPLVRENAFDVSELSVMTYIQAKSLGKPYVLVPATVLGRFQHVFLTVRAGSAINHPKQLEGLRVGIRSYTVTTVTWARAIIQSQYGADIDAITWVAFEDGHVAEFTDPPNVERIEMQGRSLEDLLLAGEIDAAVLGKVNTDPALRTLFANPEEAARDWYDKFNAIQLNHMFVVHKELSSERPDIVREIYRMLSVAAQASPKSELGLNVLPFGVEANRRNLEVALDCAYAQKLIDRRMSVDELFDETTLALN